MLYILECMMRAIMAIIMGYDGTLITTGKEVTVKDIGVALLGWFITILIVLIIVYLIKYIIQLKKQKITKDGINKNEQNFMSNKKVVNPFLYVLECIALCVLSMHGGINRPMITTGQKPKSKEVVVAISAWIYIGVIILGIVLTCSV